MAKKTRQDFINAEVAKVTGDLTKLMRQGVAPWQRGFVPSVGGLGAQKIANLQQTYSGLNSMVLTMQAASAGYEHNVWGTYSAFKKKGYRVNQKSHARIICWFEKPLKDEDGEIVTDDDGQPVKYLAAKAVAVFNIAQTAEGADFKPKANRKPVAPLVQSIDDAGELALAVLEGSKVETKWQPTPSPCYVPSLDEIRMPPVASWLSAERMAKTLFHELAHATGAKHRLDRPGITDFSGFGSHGYALEELVAELTAASLCRLGGIDTPETDANSAAYLKSWAQKLDDNPSLWLSVAKQAEAAANWLVDAAEVSLSALETIAANR
jgi:antirestriction protein ArdC